MRIEDHFHNRQHTARLQRIVQFRKSRATARDLPENSNQHRPIKLIPGQLSVPDSSLDKLDIPETCGFHLQPGASKHARLDIQRNDLALRAYAFGQGHRETPGPTSGIQNSHASGKSKRINNECSAVCPGKRIIELDQPAQPHRAGNTLPC